MYDTVLCSVYLRNLCTEMNKVTKIGRAFNDFIDRLVDLEKIDLREIEEKLNSGYVMNSKQLLICQQILSDFEPTIRYFNENLTYLNIDFINKREKQRLRNIKLDSLEL